MYLRPAVTVLMSLSILLGIVYPLTVTGIANVWFPKEAQGSLIIQNNQVIGSTLIGQSFTEFKYFWGRPANNPDDPYNPLASGGTNFAATNPLLIERSLQQLKKLSLNQNTEVPTVLISHSASGLDPHIDLDSALVQVDRVAKARSLSRDVVEDLVMKSVKTDWSNGWALEVNVVSLNLSLDDIASSTH